MKKVLFILHYPPPVHGATMMGQHIKDSEVIKSSFDCRYINLGTSITIHSIGKGGYIKLKRFFSIAWATFRQCLQFKPDLIYFTLTTSGLGFFKDALIVLLVKFLGNKVVFHFHNKGVSRYQNRWGYHIIYRLVFKNSFVILLADELYSDVKKYVAKEQVYICANGIPDISLKQKVVPQSDKVQLLFLSNLISSKGIFDLLGACQILQQKEIKFSCTFVGGEGDITAAEFQKNIDTLDLTENVSYVGRKYGMEKEEMYRQANIFTLPTFYANECFPLVLLEAMQYSLPIVSTFEGGVPEIVEDGVNGFLVPQQNVPELASALERLMQDADLRKVFGLNGRQRYAERFTLPTFEANFTNILNKLVDS